MCNRWLAYVSISLSCGFCAGLAVAQDGLYGRLSGDMSWMLSALGGAEIPLNAAPSQGVISAELRWMYLNSAGLWVGPEFGLAEPAYQRTRMGTELRPIFLARFFMNYETEKSAWDMFIDSWAIEMSVVSPHQNLGVDTEWGFSTGLGFEWPLIVNAENGNAWLLRGLCRYDHQTASAQNGYPGVYSDINLLVGIGFRSYFLSGMASRETRVQAQHP